MFYVPISFTAIELFLRRTLVLSEHSSAMCSGINFIATVCCAKTKNNKNHEL